jgi:hypothetical protein
MNISTCDKRIPNVFAYSETRTRDLIVPSIGEEQVSTVAKPELEVAVWKYAEFLALYTKFCTREIAVKI